MDQFLMQPGQGWMSRDAAKVAYDLTDKELQQVFNRLKPIGATCVRGQNYRKASNLNCLDYVKYNSLNAN